MLQQTMSKNVTILGICGSPRNSATHEALTLALEAAESVGGVTIQRIDLNNQNIQCCRNCNVCLKKKCGYCPVIDDSMEREYYELYKKCDGILLASPLYYMTATGLLQNFLSRMRPLADYARQGNFGSRMGGAIAVGGMRNGGQDFCLSVLNNMLLATGTNIIGGGVQFYNGASVWSQNNKKLTDDIGMAECKALGRKLAIMCKVVIEGKHLLQQTLEQANFLGFEDVYKLAEASKVRGLE